MTSKKVNIHSSRVLHTEDNETLAKIAQKFNSNIWLEFQGKRAKAKSVINVLALALYGNTKITISADGTDEAAAIEALETYIQSGFSKDVAKGLLK